MEKSISSDSYRLDPRLLENEDTRSSENVLFTIDTLPAEVLELIFSYVPVSNISQVCSSWNDLNNSNALWRNRFYQVFSEKLKFDTNVNGFPNYRAEFANNIYKIINLVNKNAVKCNFSWKYDDYFSKEETPLQQVVLCNIAKHFAKEQSPFLRNNIRNFKIQSEEIRMDLAKKAAGIDENFCKYTIIGVANLIFSINNFDFSDDTKEFLAKKFAVMNPEALFRNIDDFCIKNKTLRDEIAVPILQTIVEKLINETRYNTSNIRDNIKKFIAKFGMPVGFQGIVTETVAKFAKDEFIKDKKILRILNLFFRELKNTAPNEAFKIALFIPDEKIKLEAIVSVVPGLVNAKNWVQAINAANLMSDIQMKNRALGQVVHGLALQENYKDSFIVSNRIKDVKLKFDLLKIITKKFFVSNEDLKNAKSFLKCLAVACKIDDIKMVFGIISKSSFTKEEKKELGSIFKAAIPVGEKKKSIFPKILKKKF